MKAYKCDACGKLYEIYPVDRDTDDVFGTNTLMQAYDDSDHCHNPLIYKKKYELCQECCVSFNTWLESRKESYNMDQIYFRAVDAMGEYSKGNTDEETEDRHN